MTSRQLYDGLLIELHKENAPNILLEDFNYFANKTINQYINKRYNIYDVNQQTTDDLRVLKATALLIPKKVENFYDGLTNTENMATYYVDLPPDYLHLLNCICIYNVKKTYKCYNAGDTWRAAATRLTADAYSQVLDNFWLKPTYKRPYYYIHNINTTFGENVDELISNPINTTTKQLQVPIEEYYDENDIPSEYDGDIDFKLGEWLSVGDNTYKRYLKVYYVKDSDFESTGGYHWEAQYNTGALLNGVIQPILDLLTRGAKVFIEVQDGTLAYVSKKTFEGDSIEILTSGTDYIGEDNFPKSILIGQKKSSVVEREALKRYGNVSKVRLEIRYGTDTSVFTLDHSDNPNSPLNKGGKIYIDYIKTPLHIRLTQEELDYTEDKSQMLEFPDYVCQEILNELVHIVMENISDLRLQTHPVVSLSIANPAQALAPEAAGRTAN